MKIRSKLTKVICIFLAALMLLTTFGMLFTQIAFAANNDDSSNSSSSDDDDDGITSSGTLRLVSAPEFYRVDSDGEKVREDKPDKQVKKGYTYLVEMKVIDPTVLYDESDGSNFDIETGKDSIVYVASKGGNFNTIVSSKFDMDAWIDDVDNRGGSPQLTLCFYVRPNGKGRLMDLEVGYTYTNAEGATAQSQGTISMRIGEAVLDDDASEDDEDSYLIATPNIIVTGYNYGGEEVMAGSEFPLTITFQNTSDTLALENIIMDITTTTDLAIANGSNSTYIEKLGKGEKQTKTLQMSTFSSTEPKPQQVTVKFTYEYILDKTRKTGERTEELAIPVVQLDRFSIGELSVPSQLWPGDSTYLSVEYVNKGKTTISNLAARLESDVPGISDSQTIGNIAPGESGTIDFSFTANDSGSINGKVVIVYEDAKGDEKEIERPFSATVMDMGGMYPDDGMTNMPMPMPEESNKTSPVTIVMAVVGGLMVAGLTATIIVKKVKAKREEEQDEDI